LQYTKSRASHLLGEIGVQHFAAGEHNNTGEEQSTEHLSRITIDEAEQKSKLFF
jgi:hypothetical protein